MRHSIHHLGVAEMAVVMGMDLHCWVCKADSAGEKGMDPLRRNDDEAVMAGESGMGPPLRCSLNTTFHACGLEFEFMKPESVWCML
jgi:hypothetical protein